LKIAWIKDHFAFLVSLLITLGVFSCLGILVNQNGLFFLHASSEEITPVLNQFRQNHRPLIEVNFSALYGGGGQFQVLHPLLDTRNLQYRDENPTCSDDDDSGKQIRRSFLDGVGEKPLDELPQRRLVNQKLEALERFLNHENKLPDDFVVTPPFVDDWGNSFAFRLAQKGPAPFNEKNWVEQHLSFFKISELSKILKKYQIDDLRYLVISRLSESEIEDLIKADSLVISKEYLFLKNQSRFGFSPLSYWVYDLRDFRAELNNSKYDLSVFVPGSICLQRTGNGCWTYSSKHTMSYLYRYSVAIVILVGFLVLICLLFYFKHMYQRNREQQKNRLALQVLSHEFRTPVSSMLLMLERLSAESAKFETGDQDLITRISTEVFRLQRIIEISKTYLQTESHRMHFKYIEILSINNWISDFIAEIDPSIQCELLSVDQGLWTDPFWLKFVLSNLVLNAFAHGKAPVCIRLGSDGKKIKITVEDQGKCEFKSIHEMTNAFVKSRRSHGMGLGLNIVKSVLDDWGVEIQFSTSPTSFSLSFIETKGG
jgi:anti-sigma regulatory factor (Ser/Thr protein kinase)